MKTVFLFLVLTLLVFGSQAQSTGSARVSATITTAAQMCALSVSEADYSQFSLLNGNNVCVDISVSTDPGTITGGMKIEPQDPETTTSGRQTSNSNSNDLLINLPDLKIQSLSVHYN